MIVNVRFVGSLRSVSGKSRMTLDLEKNVPLKEALRRLAEKKPKLGRALIDTEFDDPRLNALVIVNDKEISVLDGLNTMLKNRDEIVFVPVLHGG